jgi:predicted  nucleic acid-binding Zn-ribbon protein
MQDYTISQLTKIVKDSFARYDQQGTRHWTWETAAKDLSYQIGSLSKITLQLSGDRWAENKDMSTLQAEFRDELADIFAEVLYIASERGIDMSHAMDEMVESDTKKVTSRAK